MELGAEPNHATLLMYSLFSVETPFFCESHQAEVVKKEFDVVGGRLRKDTKPAMVCTTND
ncbi:hypothetical protein TSUD_221250 [Trifolium subterraneum]|uniref:Uncharacterized protein n=1 Tax=Trifolium subterraneum TaxID=3900 RepID=A0A2Z6NUT1_TRISU|nr:hypothetical protein TSUD_221250 [Trifolium subterraneum]